MSGFQPGDSVLYIWTCNNEIGAEFAKVLSDVTTDSAKGPRVDIKFENGMGSATVSTANLKLISKRLNEELHQEQLSFARKIGPAKLAALLSEILNSP